MNHKFYCRMAWTNLKKNKKLYLPYLLSALFTVVTFFTITTIAKSRSLQNMKGGNTLQGMLYMGIIVIGFFSVIFLYYTNGFLIKQRKKELGLYCILGLEKKHMAIVLLNEMFISYGMAVGGGLIVGTMLSKLIFLLLLNLVNFDITLQLEFQPSVYLITAIVYLVIFIAMYIKNLLQVHLTKPIELLKGTNQGEKEPKASWILAILGVLSLGLGYYIALSITNPVAALTFFFVAVILVIIGTNLIFTSASIYILKFLKKRKKFYYRSKNFISVSGMIYRMKQNAVGLANICILSTMVIICITCVVSLYTGQKDIMAQLYPRDVEIRADLSKTDANEVNQYMDEMLAQSDVEVTFRGEFRTLGCYNLVDRNQLTLIDDSKSVDVEAIGSFSSLQFIPLEDFNTYINGNYTLEDKDEILFFDSQGEFPYNTLELGNQSLTIKEVIPEFNHIAPRISAMDRVQYAVVQDFDTIKEIYEKYTGSDMDEAISMFGYYNFYLDVDGELDECIAFEGSLLTKLRDEKITFRYQAYHVDNMDWYATYGGLLFIGVYFGLLFLMATVLIIYYKQITEGYDDRERFNIMQKVGMSRLEVKKTIHKQILLVFTLPVAIAVCHTLFALPMLKRMFQIFSLYNTPLIHLSTAATIITYAILYGIVYCLTAKAYYKIVEY